MSQNGEASSSETRPSSSSTFSPELSEGQKQVIDKCTNIVQEFRTGKVSKSKASLLLQQCIPHDNPDVDTFISVYESYFDMLDNFERYRSGNVERIDDVHRHLASTRELDQ